MVSFPDNLSRAGKSFWILMKQEMIGGTGSGSGINCTICKSFAPRCRQ